MEKASVSARTRIIQSGKEGRHGSKHDCRSFRIAIVRERFTSKIKYLVHYLAHKSRVKLRVFN